MSLTPRIDRLEQNIFINGGMGIAQRTAGPIAISGAGYDALDRWVVVSTGVTSPQVRRTGPIGYSGAFISNYTQGFNGTINSATDEFFAGQRIEASRLRAIMSGEYKISGSIAVAPSTDCDVEITIAYPNAGEDDYTGGLTNVYTNTVSVSGHTVVKFEDIDLPDTALNNGIYVYFYFTNWASTGSQFIDISDAMLNPGRNVANFNERDPGEELSLCKRYYQRFDAGADSSNYVLGGGHAGAVNTAFVAVMLPKEMRAIPLITSGGTTYPFRVQRGTGSRAFQLTGTSSISKLGAVLTLGNPDVADLTAGSGVTVYVDVPGFLDFNAEL